MCVTWYRSYAINNGPDRYLKLTRHAPPGSLCLCGNWQLIIRPSVEQRFWPRQTEREGEREREGDCSTRQFVNQKLARFANKQASSVWSETYHRAHFYVRLPEDLFEYFAINTPARTHTHTHNHLSHTLLKAVIAAEAIYLERLS